MSEQTELKARHPLAEAWDMFRRDHMAMFGRVLLLGIIFTGIFGPVYIFR